MINNSCNEQPAPTGRGFVIVIVLYILLAIMFSSFLGC